MMPASMKRHSSGANQQRDGINRERPVGALRIGIDVVSDAVFADATFRVLPAMRQLVRTDGLQRFE